MKKYFLSPSVDFFFLSGITLLTWLIAPASSYEIAISLTLFINWPHFSMTSYRLYHQKKFFMQFPLTSFLIPVLIVIATLFSFMNPTQFGVIWVKLFLIWSPYHFSGQTLGLALLYARRGGIEISRAQRFFLASVIYGSYIVMTAGGEVGDSNHTYYGVSYPTFGIPIEVVTVLWYWLAFSSVGLVASFIPHFKNFGSFPPFVLILPATQCFWFLLGPRWPGFNEFVPALHSLQYIFIAWALQLTERNQVVFEQKKSFRPLRESLRWYALNVAGGAILFHYIPTWGEKYGLPQNVAWALILSSVQIHHFFVDGVIWKLKDSTIRNPLMASASEWKYS